VIYEYICPKCSRHFEEIRSIKDRNEVFCCNIRSEKLICSGPQISDDQMWNFTAETFGNNPVEIHSKIQYKKLMKEYNQADASVADCIAIRRDSKRFKKSRDNKARKEFSSNVSKKIKEECSNSGISGQSVNDFMKDFSSGELKKKDIAYEPVVIKS